MERIKDSVSATAARIFGKPDKYKKFHNPTEGEDMEVLSRSSGVSTPASESSVSLEMPQRSRSVSICSTKSSDGHCHTTLTPQLPEVDERARRTLIIASILCLLFAIGEAVGGILAKSLAVATDSAHMLTDFASFMISLLAVHLASRRPTTKLSFGWHRAEMIGALMSVQLIWVVTGILVYMAVQRVISNDYTIEAVPMMATASCAVLINIVLGITLNFGGGGHGHSHFGGSHSHGHSHSSPDKQQKTLTKKPLITDEEKGYQSDYGAMTDEEDNTDDLTKKSNKQNINVRAALIHVIGDLIQSLGVLTASIIIYFKPEWKLADPICTFLFSVLVIFSTVNILKDIIRVLMQATPQHIQFEEVKDVLMSVDGVKDVHDLRLWSMTTNKFTASVHLAIDDLSRSQSIILAASRILSTQFDIHDSTIQVETYSADMDDCYHCQDPEKH